MAKRFLKTTVVSVIFALTLAVSASAATAGGATTTTAVNFRTGAGTNYGIISTLPAGTHVVVSERSSGNWATVVYNGTVGYISSDYLKRANDMDASFGTGTIDGSYVRMRSRREHEQLHSRHLQFRHHDDRYRRQRRMVQGQL